MNRQANASAKSKHPQADTVAAQLPQRTKTTPTTIYFNTFNDLPITNNRHGFPF